MAPRIKLPLSLPATAETWYCVVRRADTWVAAEPGSDEYFRPFVLLVVQLGPGLVIAAQVLKGTPSPEELQRYLFDAMREPMPLPGSRPHRPGAVAFEEDALAQAMAPLLAPARVQSRCLALPEEVEEALAGLMSVLAIPSGDELRGLLDKGGVTPEQVGEFFRAAAAFYRAEPWIRLSNEDVLAIQVLPGRKRWLVVVMGQAGQEYGLSLFRDREELERFFGDPMANTPSGGRHALLFSEPPYVSFGDVDAVERYGWELPEPNLYPTPSVFKSRSVGRPDAAMLRWYEAALLAIPLFVAHHLVTGARGELAPAEADVTVPTGAGDVRVHLSYPGADISQIVPHTPSLLEDDEGDALPLVFGPGSAEKYLAAAADELGVERLVDEAVGKAQGVIYRAWEEQSPARRVALARQALEISPDCADAYVILAEDAAQSAGEALTYYEAGVAAGRRALGEAFFLDPESAGHFWEILETRPFMRALEGMSGLLVQLGRTDEAVAGYRELLHLNPHDNQGMRYLLLRLLVELGRDEEAQALLNEYEKDWSAEWHYTAALLAFRRGAGPKGDKSLKAALRMNPYVSTYLTGRRRIPGSLPDSYTPGEESEAVLYAAYSLNEWRKTPGAVEWLRRLAGGQEPPAGRP
ncbi:MAG: DUF7309 domain-containing protein [Anaerolineae bacterium]